MKTIPFADLPQKDQDVLRKALARTAYSLNKLTGPQLSTTVCTPKHQYVGNNLFLSNCSLFCSEASALLAAVAHDDTDIQSIYVAARRNDGKPCAILTPCGNCRQIISDFSVVARHPIIIYCTNDKLEEVVTMTSDELSDELLPATFQSVALAEMMAAK